MDEWNRSPEQQNEQEQQSQQNAPYNPYGWNQPSADSEQPQQPYNPYGWNQPNHQPQPPKPPQKNRTGLVIGLISGICATVIVVLSALLIMSGEFNFSTTPNNNLGSNNNSDNNTTVTRPINGPTLEITELDENTQGISTRDIVKQNIDSTVLLTIYENRSFGYGGGFSQNGQEQEVEAGSATGIIMSADGYIITNCHCVVDEETNKPFPRVDVVLNNGTVYERATLIGSDPSTDLAVIKVDADNLQAATFGDSSTLQLGDKVVAVGNAGGLGLSVTQGIVSALARDVYEDTGYAIKCLQVDAAINPGNSGGPLFNAAGQVIAVNSAKIISTEYEGLGFSIPINEAKEIIDELIKNGYVTGRVSLGITGYTYSDAYYQGFLIETVNDDSALKNTDVRRGDLITKVDGEEVTDYATLRSALAKHKVGDTITLTYLRSSNRKVTEHTITVTLGEAKQ